MQYRKKIFNFVFGCPCQKRNSKSLLKFCSTRGFQKLCIKMILHNFKKYQVKILRVLELLRKNGDTLVSFLSQVRDKITFLAIKSKN